MQPSYPLGMKGQKLHLDQQQKKKGADDERDPGDDIREKSQPARAQARGSRENLDKNIGRKLPSQTFYYFCPVTKLIAELFVEHADLARQHNEMHECVGMRDNENNWCQNKKSDKRQWHVTQKRQFDRIF